MSSVFLNNLRDKFTDVNFIGIRVMDSRDVGRFLRTNDLDCNTEEYKELKIAIDKYQS